MADVFSARKRSAIIACVRNCGNKRTAIALLNILRRYKLTGWRRHQPDFGKPEFGFPKQCLVVFVGGGFSQVVVQRTQHGGCCDTAQTGAELEALRECVPPRDYRDAIIRLIRWTQRA